MESPLLFKILDVIKLERHNSKIKTFNKSCFVLSCRIEGESLFFYNNKEIKVKKGEILYIPYGSSYLQESKNEEVITFHLEAYSEMPTSMSIHKTENPELVCRLFEKAYREFSERKPNYVYRTLALLYEILSLIDLKQTESINGTNPVFTQAFRQMEADMYDKSFSIEDLCSKANISRAYFNKLFKREHGTTPINYVNLMRVKKAKLLLESGNYRNEEIANLCGFNDVKYFYVIFKKLTGETTQHYLKKIQKK